MAAPAVVATFGCFAYSRLSGERLRLHFQNAETDGRSPLARVDAYRRLFPPSYLATAHVIPRRFQHMPLWGQFLDRHGAVKEDRARQFLERLERESSPDGLEQCFPLQVLSLTAPVQDFYAFHGIQGPP